ncbi:MAG: THUMP domain-containing protein [Candidatus Bathyarchaeota archaeon]|nr:MAG: THUMP domain-containing protein [Candidatus Bathyarchaeota archaeon]
MKLKTLLKDFNLLATTSRGNDRQMHSELLYLLKEEMGDPAPVVGRTGIRGLVAAKTAFDPYEVIDKFRAILQERPYKFRYALRIIPVERVVRTNLDEVKRVATELAAKIEEKETFRVTVEKRFTNLHTRDFIEVAATGIKRKVNLENPDKILLIEVVAGLTGMSLIKPSDVLVVVKEKML